MLQSLGSQKVEHDWINEQQYNNKNNEKGVKETAPTWNPNWLFPATLTLWGFPDSPDGEESAYNARDKVHPCVGKIPWRREWLSTSVSLLGEFHEQRSLVGYSPFSHKESDMTEQLTLKKINLF